MRKASETVAAGRADRRERAASLGVARRREARRGARRLRARSRRPRLLDVGASTGGFTDVLLTRGARTVVRRCRPRPVRRTSARRSARAASLEGLDARRLTAEIVGVPPQAIVCDVSFISQRLVLPPVLALAVAPRLARQPDQAAIRGRAAKPSSRAPSRTPPRLRPPARRCAAASKAWAGRASASSPRRCSAATARANSCMPHGMAETTRTLTMSRLERARRRRRRRTATTVPGALPGERAIVEMETASARASSRNAPSRPERVDADLRLFRRLRRLRGAAHERGALSRMEARNPRSRARARARRRRGRRAGRRPRRGPAARDLSRPHRRAAASASASCARAPTKSSPSTPARCSARRWRARSPRRGRSPAICAASTSRSTFGDGDARRARFRPARLRARSTRRRGASWSRPPSGSIWRAFPTTARSWSNAARRKSPFGPALATPPPGAFLQATDAGERALAEGASGRAEGRAARRRPVLRRRRLRAAAGAAPRFSPPTATRARSPR